MNTNIDFSGKSFLAIIPHSGPCYNFIKENNRLRKTVWLVPHVIKHKEESEVISWRCNWGNICESECIYAMTKDRSVQSF